MLTIYFSFCIFCIQVKKARLEMRVSTSLAQLLLISLLA